MGQKCVRRVAGWCLRKRRRHRVGSLPKDCGMPRWADLGGVGAGQRRNLLLYPLSNQVLSSMFEIGPLRELGPLARRRDRRRLNHKRNLATIVISSVRVLAVLFWRFWLRRRGLGLTELRLMLPRNERVWCTVKRLSSPGKHFLRGLFKLLRHVFPPLVSIVSVSGTMSSSSVLSPFPANHGHMLPIGANGSSSPLSRHTGFFRRKLVRLPFPMRCLSTSTGNLPLFLRTHDRKATFMLFSHTILFSEQFMRKRANVFLCVPQLFARGVWYSRLSSSRLTSHLCSLLAHRGGCHEPGLFGDFHLYGHRISLLVQVSME